MGAILSHAHHASGGQCSDDVKGQQQQGSLHPPHPTPPCTPPPLPQGMQPAFELPPAGPPPFVQTTFGEVLAARVAGTAPRGSPFCTALQADGELLPGWAGGAVATSHLHARASAISLHAMRCSHARPLRPRPSCPAQACPCRTPRRSSLMAPSTTPPLWRRAPPSQLRPPAPAPGAARCLPIPARRPQRVAWPLRRARRTPTRWPSWPLLHRWMTSEGQTCMAVQTGTPAAAAAAVPGHALASLARSRSRGGQGRAGQLLGGRGGGPLAPGHPPHPHAPCPALRLPCCASAALPVRTSFHTHSPINPSTTHTRLFPLRSAYSPSAHRQLARHPSWYPIHSTAQHSIHIVSLRQINPVLAGTPH